MQTNDQWLELVTALAILLIILSVLVGMTRTLFGQRTNPFWFAGKVTKWLARQLRLFVAGLFRWIANQIAR